jgi:predicted phosphate transport protein (TIGR00153 family)
MSVLRRLGIMPKQDEFFRLLVKQAANTNAGAERLLALLEHYGDPELGEKELHAIEHHGDELVHDIIQLLNESFITPIDREDIHQLTSHLDDVIDLVHEVSEHLVMYRIREIRPEALELARLIPLTTREICAAIDQLDGGRETGRPHWVEINRLENEGDRISKAAIARLFEEEGIAPLEVIKWKDVFDRLEAAIDAAEDVANVLETIALKNG